MRQSPAGRASVLGAVVLMTPGCSGVPTLVVAGAYFPAWLVCCLIGLLGSVVARIVWLAVWKNREWPFPLLTCLSVGVFCGSLVWVFWRGI